jgi:hypothetical protein
MILGVKIKGVKGIQKAVKDLEEKYKKEVPNIVRQELEIAVNDMRNDANSSHWSNGIAGSIHFKEDKGAKGQALMGIEVTAPHAPFMEYGTGSRTKLPKGTNLQSVRVKGFKPYGPSFWNRLKDWGERMGFNYIGIRTVYQDILANGLTPRPFFWGNYFKARKKIIDRINALKK